MFLQVAESKFQQELYDVTCQDEVAVGLPQSPIAGRLPRKPFAVFPVDAKLAPSEEIIGFAYTLDGNNIPQVTVNFGTAITRQVRIAVLYQL